MKKKTKQKKQTFWFKFLLSILLILILLLVWVGSEKKAASNILQTFTNTPTNNNADDIGQVIAPLLDDSYVLTFEDELPDPIFKDTNQDATIHPAENRHVLSLIIDDVGYDLHALERLITLPYTITVSILPDADRKSVV